MNSKLNSELEAITEALFGADRRVIQQVLPLMVENAKALLSIQKTLVKLNVDTAHLGARAKLAEALADTVDALTKCIEILNQA